MAAKNFAHSMVQIPPIVAGLQLIAIVFLVASVEIVFSLMTFEKITVPSPI
jgi:hypothetical protein